MGRLAKILGAFEKAEYSGDQEKKIAKVMAEFKAGKLKDSHGNVVTDRGQALAIAISQAKSISKAENDDLEKGRTVHPVGSIKEFGGRNYIKTPTGWKYHGKGTGVKAQAHAAEHGSKEEQSSSTQGNLPAVGSTVHVDDSGTMTALMAHLAGKELKVVDHVKGTASIPKFLKVQDSNGETYEINPNHVKASNQSNASKRSQTGHKPTSTQSRQESLMKPHTGKLYQVSTRGRGVMQEHVIEAMDGMHMVNMTFDSESAARDFAKKKGFPMGDTAVAKRHLEDIEDAIQDLEADWADEDAMETLRDAVTMLEMAVMTRGAQEYTHDISKYEKMHEEAKREAQEAEQKETQSAEHTKRMNQQLKDIRENVKSFDSYLSERHGFAENHKMRQGLKQGLEAFEKQAEKVNEKLGKDYKLTFDFSPSKDSRYPAFTFQVGFDKFDLRDKFPEEYQNASAGLASSKLNNFAASKGGKILKEAGLFPGKSYGSSGYSYNNHSVGFGTVFNPGPTYATQIDRV